MRLTRHLVAVSTLLSSQVLFNRAASASSTSSSLSSSVSPNPKFMDVNSEEGKKYLQKAANELIEIVDESNNVLTPTNRAEMRANRLIHRATYAFVRNSNNYFYVQKRSALKDYCPSFYDPTPGGVVGAGESYEDTNRREIEEEMGIRFPSSSAAGAIKHMFTFYYEDERIRCWGDAWDVVYDGPLKLQAEEVDSVHMMSMQEILSRSEAGEDFTPDRFEFLRKKGSLIDDLFNSIILLIDLPIHCICYLTLFFLCLYSVYACKKYMECMKENGVDLLPVGERPEAEVIT